MSALAETVGLVPGTGLVGALLTGFALYAKTGREDRAEYRAALAAARADFEARLAAEHERTAEEIDDLRRRLADSDTEVDDLHRRLTHLRAQSTITQGGEDDPTT